MTFKPHEAARQLRPMNELEYKGLLDDIKVNGQRTPIVLLAVTPDETVILDGINRDRACRELKIEPLTRYFDEATEGDPVQFVISMNMARRHLSDWDAAAGAQRLVAYIKKQTKERTKRNAALLPGVTEHTKEMAATVKADAEPELIAALEGELVDLASAAAMAAYEPELQRKMVEEIKAEAEKPAPIVRAKVSREGLAYEAGELSPTDVAALVTGMRVLEKSVHAEAAHAATVLRRMVPKLKKL